MIRATVLSTCLLLALAGTADATLAGRRLVVTDGCSSGGTIAIDPDPGLVGGITVDGPTAEAPSAGADRTVTVIPACGDDTVHIRVPSTFPVDVAASGDRNIHLGDLAGPVSVEITGSTLSAGVLGGPVRIEQAGDGDMTIASLGGATRVVLRGSGDLAIGQATVPVLSLAMAGSGDVRIGGGAIGRLELAMQGSGDVAFKGTVGAGSIDDSGDGDVSISRVTGDLSEVQRGSGDIHVGARGDGGSARPSFTAPFPPIPRFPPIPPVPVLSIEPPRLGVPADTGHPVADLVRATTVCTLIGCVGALLVGLRRRRGVRSPNAPVRADIVRLGERLDAVARRTGALEHAVTSDEFDLDRRFREIGADRRA